MNINILEVLPAVLLFSSCSGSVTTSEATMEVREEEKAVLDRKGWRNF